MLIFSLSAPTVTLIGWLFLDETYVFHQWVGIFDNLSEANVLMEDTPIVAIAPGINPAS